MAKKPAVKTEAQETSPVCTTVLDTKELLRALNVVNRAVDSHPQFPVLGNILFTVSGSTLSLKATKLTLTINLEIACTSDTDWQFTLPRLVVDLLKTFNVNNPTTLLYNADANVVMVKNGKSVNSIRGIPADKFPILDVESSDNPTFQYPAQILCPAIRSTVYAASNEIGSVLSGLILNFEGDTLKLMATDRQRVAWTAVEIEGSALTEAFKPFTIAIPSITMREVERLYGDMDEDALIQVEIGKLKARFSCNGVDAQVQVLSEFYQPQGLDRLPEMLTTRITIETELLRTAIKRVRIFAQDANHTCQLNIVEDGVEVSGMSKERGDNFDLLEADIEGDFFSVRENSDLLLDALDVFGDSRYITIVGKASHLPILLDSPTMAGVYAAISPLGSGG